MVVCDVSTIYLHASYQLLVAAPSFVAVLLHSKWSLKLNWWLSPAPRVASGWSGRSSSFFGQYQEVMSSMTRMCLSQRRKWNSHLTHFQAPIVVKGGFLMLLFPASIRETRKKSLTQRSSISYRYPIWYEKGIKKGHIMLAREHCKQRRILSQRWHPQNATCWRVEGGEVCQTRKNNRLPHQNETIHLQYSAIFCNSYWTHVISCSRFWRHFNVFFGFLRFRNAEAQMGHGWLLPLLDFDLHLLCPCYVCHYGHPCAWHFAVWLSN